MMKILYKLLNLFLALIIILISACHGEFNDINDMVDTQESAKDSEHKIGCEQAQDIIILNFDDGIDNFYVYVIDIEEFIRQSDVEPIEEKSAIKFAANSRKISPDSAYIKAVLAIKDSESNKEITYYIIGFEGLIDDIVILPDGRLVMPQSAEKDLVYGGCKRRPGELEILRVR